jgi:predicted metal-dependent RNase
MYCTNKSWGSHYIGKMSHNSVISRVLKYKKLRELFDGGRCSDRLVSKFVIDSLYGRKSGESKNNRTRKYHTSI